MPRLRCIFAHLHLDDGAGEHAAADGHVAGEGALLVNVVALARLLLGSGKS